MNSDEPRIGIAVDRIMEEARRRYESFAIRYDKSVAEGWLGLGMPSEYRPAVEAGYMTPLHGKATRRVLNWYLLTDRGVELYRRMFPGSEDGSRRKYRDGLEVEPYSIHDEARNDEEPACAS